MITIIYAIKNSQSTSTRIKILTTKIASRIVGALSKQLLNEKLEFETCNWNDTLSSCSISQEAYQSGKVKKNSFNLEHFYF